jgi:hypothetical protein
MDDLLALIAAIFDAFTKRERPASRLGQALRDAFAERVPVPGAPAAGAGPPVSPGLSPAAKAPSQPNIAPLPVARPPAGSPQSFGAASPPDGARRGATASHPPEAGRVTALFANPQSLVAAFIVAEVLAKPVALRDSPAASLHAE